MNEPLHERHLAGCLVAVIVHGDVEGPENVRRSISDWLGFMHLSPAGALAELDRHIGYWKPYATSHDDLDADESIQDEIRNAALDAPPSRNGKHYLHTPEKREFMRRVRALLPPDGLRPRAATGREGGRR
jgi:hypothetical protein